ncbi:hypothetical protein RvY_11052 [Ramazzottius varieornatus]|uniref:Uncharacterized protein n=1 Tax=Ramazzottius varieornatus TaxID=947166 RepID=A0A1D1VEU1_RAMVA|nr:hypothetical protein RvY_11052 [Ramazzottius varieornatus]
MATKNGHRMQRQKVRICLCLSFLFPTTIQQQKTMQQQQKTWGPNGATDNICPKDNKTSSSKQNRSNLPSSKPMSLPRRKRIKWDESMMTFVQLNGIKWEG